MEFSGVFLLEMGMLEKYRRQLMNQQLNNLLEVGEIILEDGYQDITFYFYQLLVKSKDTSDHQSE